jgi:adenylate cyclase
LESVDAALMLCDLRGFTELSNRLAPERVIALLDSYFDRVVPAIGAAGGEVLKFMGDGVLAFFPQDTADAACAMALAGAEKVLANLRPGQDSELSVGIALHYGRVSYGNIGSGRRLDFTVIGPDVNLVSRIQSVCSTTGHRLLVSERFLTLLHEQRFTAAGSHVPKGFEQPVRLYTIASAA